MQKIPSFICSQLKLSVGVVCLLANTQSALAGASFNQDATDDLLWQNRQTGALAVYEMQGHQFKTRALQPVNLAWVPYRGDFNGDGMQDILWRNLDTGVNWLNTVQGSAIVGSKQINQADLAWSVAAIGDFDGNGTDDIIWRHADSGVIWCFLMDGHQIKQSKQIHQIQDPQWRLVGAGDLDGDGTDDLLWRHRKSGRNHIYKIVNGQFDSGVAFQTISGRYQIEALQDYNHDHTDDLLLRDSETGKNSILLLQQFKVVKTQTVNTVADLNWRVADSADYNGDGTADILWRHFSTGQNIIYFMQDARIDHVKTLNTIKTHAWQPVQARLQHHIVSDYQDHVVDMNQGITGRLFSNNWDGYLDLYSGETISLVPMDSRTFVSPSSDGQLFVHTNAYYRSSSYNCYNSYLYIREVSSARSLKRFTIPAEVLAPAKMSQDGQYIAVRSRCGVLDDQQIRVFDVEGNQVSNWQISDVDFQDFAWLPDNRLVLSSWRRLRIQGTPFTDDFSIADIPGDIAGGITSLKAHPSGDFLMFEMTTDSGFDVFPGTTVFGFYRDAYIYKFDIATQQVSQFTEYAGGPQSKQHNMPVFSPDGRWMLASIDFRRIINTSTQYTEIQDTNRYYQANKTLPWHEMEREDLGRHITSDNGLLYAISLDESKAGFHLQQRGQLVKPLRAVLNGEPRNVVTSPKYPLYWAKHDGQRPVANKGHLPVNSMAPNLGLPQTLTYAAKSEQDEITLYSHELASNQKQPLFNLPSNANLKETFFSYSADQQLVAVNLNNGDELLILDAQGNTLRQIELNDSQINWTNFTADINGVVAEVYFHPQNSDFVALLYVNKAMNNKQMVMFYNWKEDLFYSPFYNDFNIDAMKFMRDGRLATLSNGQLELTTLDLETYGVTFEPLWQQNEPITNFDISPDDHQMVIRMGGHLWIIDVDGQNLRQLTSPYQDFEFAPRWSSDGQYILFKKNVDGEHQVYVVAADAQNVKVGRGANTKNAFQLGLNTDAFIPAIYGSIYW